MTECVGVAAPMDSVFQLTLLIVYLSKMVVVVVMT